MNGKDKEILRLLGRAIAPDQVVVRLVVSAWVSYVVMHYWWHWQNGRSFAWSLASVLAMEVPLIILWAVYRRRARRWEKS